MSGANVLLVEDDVRLGRLTARYLSGNDVHVTLVPDGDAALAAIRHATPDLILLDLMLPGLDGIEVCRLLRTRIAVPIIMLTARGEEADRVQGLEAGADDYVTKPYSARELLARIRAQLRRARGQAGPASTEVRAGALVLEPATMGATLGDKRLDLTAYEFAILRALAEHAGRVLTREQLLDLAKGSAEEAFDRSIDVRISRLRAKLADDARRPTLLKTIRGVGYMLSLEAR